MADFEKAFEHLKPLEGGYSCDPADHGGETFMGISRKYWPQWIGWKRVEQLKACEHFPELLRHDAIMLEDVEDFYRMWFWTPRLALLVNQDLANWLFQISVNVGATRAIKFLQQSLDIPDDGRWGDQTCRAVDKADQVALLERCRNEAKLHYRILAQRDPSQERFLHGWLNRAEA